MYKYSSKKIVDNVDLYLWSNGVNMILTCTIYEYKQIYLACRYIWHVDISGVYIYI